MVDRIEIRGLRLAGIVGVLAEERTRAQPLEIDLDLEMALAEAGESDVLADTADYGAVCDAVASVVAQARPQLLERLAAALGDEVLSLDDRIEAVDVTVRKLRPPVPYVMDSSGVSLRRTR